MASPSLTQSGDRPECQRLVVFSYFLSYGFILILLFLLIIFLSRSLGTKGHRTVPGSGVRQTASTFPYHTPSEVVCPRVNTQWFLFVFCLMALYSYFCVCTLFFCLAAWVSKGALDRFPKGGSPLLTQLTLHSHHQNKNKNKKTVYFDCLSSPISLLHSFVVC